MRRLACLIGNDSYEHWNTLDGAVNDAMLMKSVLTDCGFELFNPTSMCNLNERNLNLCVQRFIADLTTGDDAGLLYFAGHGVEIDGRQYLVPTDAPLRENESAVSHLFDTTGLIDRISDNATLSPHFTGILILDCCRHRLHIPPAATRGPSHASPDCTKGVFVAFATKPDAGAKELHGNGLFTRSLYESIRGHGSEKLEQLLKLARRDLISRCRQHGYQEQISWDHSSLLTDFYFRDTAVLVEKGAARGEGPLTPGFLQKLYDGSLSYREIREQVLCKADELHANASQKEELLKSALEQLDALHTNCATPNSKEN